MWDCICKQGWGELEDADGIVSTLTSFFVLTLNICWEDFFQSKTFDYQGDKGNGFTTKSCQVDRVTGCNTIVVVLLRPVKSNPLWAHTFLTIVFLCMRDFPLLEDSFVLCSNENTVGCVSGGGRQPWGTQSFRKGKSDTESKLIGKADCSKWRSAETERQNNLKLEQTRPGSWGHRWHVWCHLDRSILISNRPPPRTIFTIYRSFLIRIPWSKKGLWLQLASDPRIR